MTSNHDEMTIMASCEVREDRVTSAFDLPVPLPISGGTAIDWMDRLGWLSLIHI